MVNIKVAFRITVARLADFFKSEENKVGNVTVTLDTPQYGNLAEAISVNGGEEQILAIVNQALLDVAKDTAKSVMAAKDAIAETLDLSAEGTRNAELARLTSAAQEKVAKLTKVELSTRAANMQETAKLVSLDEMLKRGETLSAEQIAEAIKIALKSR